VVAASLDDCRSSALALEDTLISVPEIEAFKQELADKGMR